MATEGQFLAGIGALPMNTTSVTVGDLGDQIARLYLSTTSLQRHSQVLQCYGGIVREGVVWQSLGKSDPRAR
jgi:hypothetical protein